MSYKWLIEPRYCTENGYPNKIEFNYLDLLNKKTRLPYSNCIVRASIGSCHTILRMKRPNLKIFFGTEKDAFDANKFMSQFGPLALNYEHIYQTWGHVKLAFNQHSKIFLRPVSGFKKFSGGVLSQDNMFDRLNEEKIDDSTLCLVSAARPIEHEYRFVVCGKEIVGWTEYLTAEQPNVPDSARKFAEEAAKNFTNPPDVLYVLDIAQSNNNFFLLEWNAFSSSGLYEMDIPTVCQKVESYLERLDSEDGL